MARFAPTAARNLVSAWRKCQAYYSAPGCNSSFYLRFPHPSPAQAARHQPHCALPTISRSVNSPRGSRALAEHTINRALKKNHTEEITIENCHSAETEPFPQEGIDCNDIFHIVFGATQPEVGGLCSACLTLLWLFCLLFILAWL